MNTQNKYTKLALSLLFDAIGLLSYAIPGLGELSDMFWAPASAYLMTKMYKGNKGKIAAAVSFIEEAIPGLDIIPTFTIMWLFTHVFTNFGKKTPSEKIIE
ncbi:hypothetical protein J2Q11_07695 [Tenacibaculum finnmarkense genomovar finnmarkense]|uniref:hypothetical protein n=1 Tax=Tenacibaculum finnmarkense TaxID=2781243 RepID=UPI000C6B0D0E|nr:hypothetical protein [Tenacibaculum finnmarkense]MCD8417617.1 hypothetical protein [Tenacibaculum finnmarkense genomovar finnmarkense]MCD8438852.1 hypothetical protein [Tenacibaculum finnmarkense genomovar ulcerans]MCG8185945.1 hypothetical protein [Tenacibaculum finnmarkense genomovar finnmarkense]MCG8202555.1 hypothetical protein [Tenacibaculum finnmarkense genomovar finnmarkense]MCG8209786.1 hypothetical protein [Tenacibaculum finnmarkense genomovar finnmarkense]